MSHHVAHNGGPQPVERVLNRLREQGSKVVRRGDAWSAQCPAHDDQRASLSISAGRDGRALLKCHAGCPWREIAAALGLGVRELFAEEAPVARRQTPGKAAAKGPLASGASRLTSTYDYRDTIGRLLYRVVRTPEKRFWVQRPDGKGGWLPGKGNIEPVPYRLPELPALPPGSLLFIGEGEKVAECLIAQGLAATTNDSGAGKWRAAHSACCRGLRCVILPDNDAPGQKHAELVLASLREAGVEAVILPLPGLPPKGDAVEWFAAGGTAAELLALAEEALAGAKNGEETEPIPAAPEPVSFIPSPLSSPPAALEPEAFHGIAGAIVQAIAPQTEADPAALLVTLLVGLGNLIGRGPYRPVGPTRHYLKLFAVIVGQSAFSRKGTTEDHMRALLRLVEPEWEASRILSGISSGEGIIHHVRDPIEEGAFDPKRRLSSRDGRDPGVTDKRLLIVESEFAQLLKVMSREGNTTSPVVRNAWDDKRLQNATKNSPETATSSHISILGYTTQDELRRYLTQTEAGNGFANRFLWVWATRARYLPHPQPVPEQAALAERLRQIVAQARQIEAIEWSAAAGAIWTPVYQRLSQGRTGLFAAVTSRAEAQVTRLASLYAVLDGAALIQPAHLLAALAVWRYGEASARFLFGDTFGDATADAILETLRQRPEGIGRGDLLHVVGHCSAARLIRTLDRLAAEGLLRREKRRHTGGRPAEWLLPVARPEEADGLDLARHGAPLAPNPENGAEMNKSPATLPPDYSVSSPFPPPLPSGAAGESDEEDDFVEVRL